MPDVPTPPDVEFRLADPDDEDLYGAFFPHARNIKVEDDLVDLTAGGGTFEYPRGGKNADLLDIKTEVVLLRDGGENRNSRFILEDKSLDQVEEGDDNLTIITWRLKPFIHRLAETVVMPRLTDDLAEPFEHIDETPGAIFLEHFHRAKDDYGALAELNADFTPTETSSGDLYDATVTTTVEVGTPLLALLGPDYMYGTIEAFTRKRTLRVQNAGYGIDWTEDQGPGGRNITLIRGRHLLDGPYERRGINVATHVMVIGDGGRFVIVDASGGDIDRYGHIWKYLPARGVTNEGALEKIGETWLQINHSARDSSTYEIALGLGADPYTHFDNGEWIYVFDGQDTLPKRHRVRRITTETDETGRVKANLTLNDWFDEHEDDLQRRLDGLTNNADGLQGGARIERDRMPPGPPTITGNTTGLTVPPAGPTRAYVQVTVAEPTTDADGYPLYDLDGLRLGWRYSGKRGWRYISKTSLTGDDLVFKIDDLVPSHGADLVEIEVIAQAFDTHGNYSAATAPVVMDTAEDHGGMRSYDETTGEEILDTRNGERFHAPTRFTVGQVPGGGGLRGIGISATGNGIELDDETGVRLWNPAGTRTIWLDPATGDLDVNGNASIRGNVLVGGIVEIDGSGGNSIWAHGNVLIAGTVTIDNTLTVNANTELAGNVDVTGDMDVTGVFRVYSAGSPVLVVNSSGATLTGSLLAGDVSIEDGVISVGSASITFSSGALQFDGSGAFSGGVSTSSTLTVSGSAVLNGPLDHNGTTLGVFSQTPRAVYGIGAAATDLASVIDLANDLRAAGIGFGFLNP